MYAKLLVIVSLFLGESLLIYTEMFSAKTHATATQPFIPLFLKMLLMILVGGGLLSVGYIFGYTTFKNIWVISAISITSILIVEPVLAWAFFHQLPTPGAIAGLVLGAIGLCVALIF